MKIQSGCAISTQPFEILQSLGIAILPADVRILQGQGARTVAMKTATKAILVKLIKERKTLN
jgi:hypothetical protein